MNTNPARREFLFAAASLPAAISCLANESAFSSDPKPPPVVDSHLHCFAGASDTRFPYHDRGPYRPVPAASPEHLLNCMKEAGVDFAIVVHPEPYQDDHRYLEHCLQIGKGRLKGTCLVFADRTGSMQQLPALVKKLPIVAVRIHAYAPDRLPPFGKPELRELWKLAADSGIAVQLHFEPRYAPGFEPLIKEFPATRVIIDHLGRPMQGTVEEHAAVVRWSRYENAVMKISALPDASQYPHRDIGPIIKRLTEAYGPDRLIYGGGFGAETTGASYRAARERVRGYLAHLSAADQAKVLGINAVRLFGFQTSS